MRPLPIELPTVLAPLTKSAGFPGVQGTRERAARASTLQNDFFCLTIVLTVDEKWFTARIKPPQVRLIPVADGMSEETGRFRLECLGSAPGAKIHAFWRS